MKLGREGRQGRGGRAKPREKPTKGEGEIEPLELRKEFRGDEQQMKEDEIRWLVAGWLWERGWRTKPGTDPPDLFATDGEKIIGIEVIAHRFKRLPFYVSKAALKFHEGAIFFIIALEIAPGRFEPFILTRNEMAAECEGKTGDRKDRYRLSIPRNSKAWEKYQGQWGKLEASQPKQPEVGPFQA